MQNTKTDIWVYIHRAGMSEPKNIGILSAQQAKGRKAFSFQYNSEWVSSKEQLLLDPDIGWYSGPQYPNQKENFGIFLDSMPDTWGRTLMKRRAANEAKEKGKPSPILYEVDFLLGVHDESRLGAIRFKLDPEGPFLNNNQQYPTPHWSRARDLQHAVEIIESDNNEEEVKKWLAILIAPGSSLGGARPKANILDQKNHPWIAKFPSKNDVVDKGAWEYLAYKLAIKAGIKMSESKIERLSGKYHTFFTKRFDRLGYERIHFSSAMTMTGKDESLIRDTPASYLDIVEFIQFSGANNLADLEQLWKRIIFNIMISNIDDHLRNHGFILQMEGWVLSPAFDINPSVDKNGLALNIDSVSNSLDVELAKSVGKYFHLKNKEMNAIIIQVKDSVRQWQEIAKQIGISKTEQEYMRLAFEH